MPCSPTLLVVLPVYNEEASIETVVRDWMEALDRVCPDFVLLAMDDGSQDRTAEILNALGREFGERLEILSRENRGHGQTCLEGYRVALQRGIPYVLQIDSDGQCDPVFFREFWEKRDEHDVIYGARTREDGFRRVVASAVLRQVLKVGFGVSCVDPNVPYRLMDTRACEVAIQGIGSGIFLANVALAVALRKQTGIRHGEVPIRFRPRIGGEPSVPFSKFAVKGLELVVQLKRAGLS